MLDHNYAPYYPIYENCNGINTNATLVNILVEKCL